MRCSSATRQDRSPRLETAHSRDRRRRVQTWSTTSATSCSFGPIMERRTGGRRDRPEESGGDELDRRASGKTGAARGRDQRRREDLCELSEGRYVARLRLRLTGKLENEITLPGPGSAGGFGGKRDDKFVFYTFVSFNVPTVDLQVRHRDPYLNAVPSARNSGFQGRQTTRRSRSSTRARTARAFRCSSSTRKACKLDGNNPTLLYGYGGFNITTSPAFSSLRLALLEQGVVYASANIAAAASTARSGTRRERS